MVEIQKNQIEICRYENYILNLQLYINRRSL